VCWYVIKLIRQVTLLSYVPIRSQDRQDHRSYCVVGIVSRLGAANDKTISTTDPPKPVGLPRPYGMHVRWPTELRNFSLSKMSRPTSESTQPPMQCVTEVIWPAVKVLWHEVDQSSTSSARTTNETRWSVNETVLLYLHGHPLFTE